jgi:hypothetical protein
MDEGVGIHIRAPTPCPTVVTMERRLGRTLTVLPLVDPSTPLIATGQPNKAGS